MLDSVITAEMLNGVLDEILGLLPIVVPVAISMLAVRKGWSFLMGVLHSA